MVEKLKEKYYFDWEGSEKRKLVFHDTDKKMTWN